MANAKLVAQTRVDFGKGASRRARRNSQIPAVVYSQDSENQHILLPYYETMIALKGDATLYEIEIGGKKELAIIKDVQKHVLKNTIMHIDFQKVSSKEKVTVSVLISVVGEPAANTLVIEETSSIDLQCVASNIPSSITVDISGLEAGSVIKAKDLVIPEDAELEESEDLDIVTIQSEKKMDTASTAEDAESAEAEGESEAE